MCMYVYVWYASACLFADRRLSYRSLFLRPCRHAVLDFCTLSSRHPTIFLPLLTIPGALLPAKNMPVDKLPKLEIVERQPSPLPSVGDLFSPRGDGGGGGLFSPRGDARAGRSVWICCAAEDRVGIRKDGSVRQSAVHWRMAHVVAGTPRGADGDTIHGEGAGGSSTKMLEVVCEGDDPVTGRRSVRVLDTFAVDADELCSGDNFAHLHNLCEPNVVRGLVLRFASDQIYTFAGPILIAMNPWKPLDIYSAAHMQRHVPHEVAGEWGKRRAGTRKEGAPHVFAVAAEAFRCLAVSQCSQSIIVSGESGSGKTETCKYLMQHLAMLSTASARGRAAGKVVAAGWAGEQGIERQVLESNPILEAFGNAKTVRNDNSSRFGKFIQLRFRPSAPDAPGSRAAREQRGGAPDPASASLQLCGGAVYTYLLERTRVVNLSTNERNYHFLYQLCAAAASGVSPLASCAAARTGVTNASMEQLTDPLVRSSLGLEQGGAAKFRLTAMGGCLQLDGVDDAAGYRRTMQALVHVGFGPDEQWELLQVLAAVLHLGNIELEADDASSFSPRGGGRGRGEALGEGEELSPYTPPSVPGATKFSGEDMARIGGEDEALRHASRLLKCDAESLERALCVRTVRASAETLRVPNTRMQGAAARDALCKFVYGRVFDWLVARINSSLAQRLECKGGGAGEVATWGVDGGGEGGASVGGTRAPTINILDIFGFEVFERNSLEQLCINYANERLQHQFNLEMIKVEQDDYRAEGVAWEQIPYADSQPCVALLEARPGGLFALLDEEGRVPRGSDEGFMQKVREVAASEARTACLSCPFVCKHEFVIAHYAGSVRYDSTGFLDKNADVLLADLRDLLRASGSELVQHLCSAADTRETKDVTRDAESSHGGTGLASGGAWGQASRCSSRASSRCPSANSSTCPSPVPETGAGASDVARGGVSPQVSSESIGASVVAGGGSGGATTHEGAVGGGEGARRRRGGAGGTGLKETVASQFRKQLASLLASIAATETHYVRCVNPNVDKTPQVVDQGRLVHQLRCSGLIEAIRLIRSSYPIRYSYADLKRQFWSVLLAASDGDGSPLTADNQITRHTTTVRGLLPRLSKAAQPERSWIDPKTGYMVSSSLVYDEPQGTGTGMGTGPTVGRLGATVGCVGQRLEAGEAGERSMQEEVRWLLCAVLGMEEGHGFALGKSRVFLRAREAEFLLEVCACTRVLGMTSVFVFAAGLLFPSRKPLPVPCNTPTPTPTCPHSYTRTHAHTHTHTHNR
jgi:hypothetical protein